MADDPTALDTAALTARLTALLHEADWADAWDLDDLYVEIGRVAEELHRRGADSLAITRARARSRVDAAWGLRDGGEREPALAAYRDVVALFANESDPQVCADVADALFNVGCLLDDLDRQMEAVVAYDQTIRRLATATEFPHVEWLLAAMGNRATLLEDLEGSESALAAWDELIRRCGDLADQPMLEHIVLRDTVWGLVGRGRCLERLGRTAEAVSTYKQVIALGPRLPDGERGSVRDAEARLAALR